MEALALRVNAWAASGQAVMDSLSLGYLDKHEQKTNEEILRELRQSKVPLTQEEETTLAILESYGGLTSFGASKQNQPGPYFAGTAAETVGEMLSGGLTGKIGSSLGKMTGKGADSLFKKLGGKYSKKLLADLAEGRLSDLPMDILDALRDATGVEDFVRRLVGNQALGLVGDSASEGLDAVRQTVRKQGNLGLIAPGQSSKMKSDSDFDVNVDVNASSLSVNDKHLQVGFKRMPSYLDIVDGKIGGKVPLGEYRTIRKLSVKNPDCNILMLGRYSQSADSYIAKAGSTASYFDLGDEWNRVGQEYGFTEEQLFNYFNKPVLDEAVACAKTIKFSHDPREYKRKALGAEWDYLKSVLGLKDDDLIFKGGFWYVKR